MEATSAYRTVNDDILRPLGVTTRMYWFFVGLAFFGVLIGASCWGYQIYEGLGVAGYSHPVVWGTYLVNFVFWVGIAHSGTLISAILFLFRAPWRTEIARSSEAMTVFAVMTAGLFPLIHLGRIWVVYWILPYPNERELWPNFQSPLVFDVVAISTYLTVSILFWYSGLIPDLAAVRDRATGLKKKVYNFFSLGWRGGHTTWRHHGTAYLLAAALATPLVVSVHSVVSWDFALSTVPGWHSTIFAPYFVAGAIHSGLAMVITLLIPMRKIYKLEHLISIRILENLAKTIILTGLIVFYSYATEFFIAWYSNNKVEWALYLYRATGPDFIVSFWIMIICNAIIPLAFFFKKLRTTIASLLVISVLINIGMWYERYLIILSSAAHMFDPWSWVPGYRPTWVELGIMYGAFSLFFFMFLLFSKFVPTISIAEVKENLPVPKRRQSSGRSH